MIAYLTDELLRCGIEGFGDTGVGDDDVDMVDSVLAGQYSGGGGSVGVGKGIKLDDDDSTPAGGWKAL